MKARTDGQCHLCDVCASVSAGLFKSVPFDKTPCAKCMNRDYKQFPHRGLSMVSLDVAPDIPNRDHPCRDDVNILVEFLSQFMRMPSDLRDIVGWRLLNAYGESHSYAEIAMRLGYRRRVSRQAVEQRLRKAIEMIPALSVLLGKDID